MTEGSSAAELLDEVIFLKGLESARKLLLSLPLDEIGEFEVFTPLFHWFANEEGEYVGRTVAPFGYLRLAALQMQSWERPARIVESPAGEALRTCGIAGLAGSAVSPVAYYVTESTGRHLEIHACRSNSDRVVTALAIPYPDAVSDGIAIPPHLVARLVEATAEALTPLAH